MTMIHLENDRFTLIGALQRYNIAWRKLLQEYQLEALGDHVVATTVSWKVGDKARLFADLQMIAPYVEQVHVGTVDKRYIASCVLHEPLEADLWIIKVLERRPGATDPLGLDSVDFITKDPQKVYETFKAIGLTVAKERNAVHDWVSVRFGTNDEFEAKFTDHLVLDVTIKEMKSAADHILKSL